MTPNVVGFIFARGGSRGLPGKNLRVFCGEPLIGRAIRAARDSFWIERVVVSTDCPRIAEIARRYGAECPFLRPPELAADSAPEWFAWRHAVQHYQSSSDREPMDVFVSVPPTAPLRRPDDVDRCVKRYLEGDVDSVITVTPARRHPQFNMVTPSGEGLVRLAGQRVESIARRQDCSTMYDITTVAYAVDPEFILSEDSLFDGRVAAVEVPEQRALDIDSSLDFEIGEFLGSRQRGFVRSFKERKAG